MGRPAQAKRLRQLAKYLPRDRSLLFVPTTVVDGISTGGPFSIFTLMAKLVMVVLADISGG